MHFTVPRSALHVALAQTARVVERRQTIAILSNVLIEAAGDGLTLTATDLDLEVRVRLEATVAKPGAITAPAGVLSGLVAKMGDGPIAFDLDDQGAQLTVSGGRTRARINVLPAGDFPRIDVGVMSHTFPLPAAMLTDAIAAVSFAISNEEIRYYLNGIFIHTAGEHLVAVATDGHRLSRWRGDMPSGAAGMPGIILPRKTVVEMAKLAAEGAKAGHADLTLAVSEAKIRLEIGPTVLTSKLIDGTFPDYGRVIPAQWASEVTLERAATLAAVDRVTTVNSERGRAVKCAFGQGKLELSTVNPDAGSASEELAISGDADFTLDIGFNARYVADALGALETDTVAIRLSEAGSPTVLVPVAPKAGAADRLIVLMPMRV